VRTAPQPARRSSAPDRAAARHNESDARRDEHTPHTTHKLHMCAWVPWDSHGDGTGGASPRPASRARPAGDRRRQHREGTAQHTPTPTRQRTWHRRTRHRAGRASAPCVRATVRGRSDDARRQTRRARRCCHARACLTPRRTDGSSHAKPCLAHTPPAHPSPLEQHHRHHHASHALSTLTLAVYRAACLPRYFFLPFAGAASAGSGGAGSSLPRRACRSAAAAS